jgi:putative transcriptional regulator
MESLKGHLLVASANLPDPNFYRSIVLIVEHDDQGAFGLVLNRTTTKSLKEVWSRISSEPCESDVRIAVGGPVPGPLIILHGHPSFSENQVVPGVYVSRTVDCLMELVRQKEHPYRLFVGYSGWGGGQLDFEMEAGSWLTAPAQAHHIFACDENHAWEQIIDMVDKQRTKDFLNIRTVADDPSLN